MSWRSRAAAALSWLLALLALLGAASAAGATVVTVGGFPGRVIAPGFVGPSLEIRGIETFTGTDPHAVNPVFEQLIRNLAPGQRPVIRLGGDTTDWTWYPIRGMRRPLGVRYSLSKQWLAVVKSFAEAVNAHLIMGVNFEVDSARVAGAEARAIASGIGSPWLQALALGNEPELYSGLEWYGLNGHAYYGRARGYNFASYLKDYSSVLRALPRTVPVAGPDAGSQTTISANMGQFLRAHQRVRIATVHKYPLEQCAPTPRVTIAELLSPASTRGLTADLGPSVRAAHAHGIPLRVDETNSVSCGGAPGVSDTFASALWSLDSMFEFAHAGVDGVNVHSKLGTANALWSFSQAGSRWQAVVNPDYYGLLAFAQAVPAGSRLLPVSGAGAGNLHVWATRGPDGTPRVVLINLDTGSAHTVIVRGLSAAAGTGALERLSAPRAGSRSGVTLGGQSFGSQTTTGLLTGALRTTSVSPSGGRYVVKLPAASAAILMLGAG
jgi:Glycosyl hydrolase family 79 C-terminal beta domain